MLCVCVRECVLCVRDSVVCVCERECVLCVRVCER